MRRPTGLGLLCLACLVTVASPVELHSLHWNSTNPIFRIDNTDHIVDVNSGNLPWEYDQLNIICPVAGRGRGTRGREDGERYIIYNVSKEEYDSCRIGQEADPRVVAVCDKPDQQLQFTITFR
jgi:ephrin-B